MRRRDFVLSLAGAVAAAALPSWLPLPAPVAPPELSYAEVQRIAEDMLVANPHPLFSSLMPPYVPPLVIERNRIPYLKAGFGLPVNWDALRG